MKIEELNSTERNILYQCMKMIAETSLIEDPEFQTRMSINRQELSKVVAAWSTLMDSIDNLVVNLAVNNSLNEVCNGIQISDTIWNQYFTDSRQDVNNFCCKWFEQR